MFLGIKTSWNYHDLGYNFESLRKVLYENQFGAKAQQIRPLHNPSLKAGVIDNQYVTGL
jgi:hypothetical protein